MPNEQVMSGLVEPHGRGEDPLFHYTRIYLLFLQGLFQQFPEGSYRWSDDERLSEIVITDQVPIPRERVEQRPAIVAMRGPTQFANLSLRTGRKLSWDAAANDVRDDRAASAMLQRAYREPWASELKGLLA